MESVWFKILLDNTIEKDQPLWEPPRNYFRASSVGEPCGRTLALSMLGHRIPFPARTLRIFKTGNAIEDVNLAVLKDAGVLVSSQGEVEFKLPDGGPFIKGHYDAVIKREKTKHLLEIKSINEFDFAKLPTEHDTVIAGDSPLMKRYPKYIQQWNTYAGHKDTPNIGMVLFEAKNSQKHKTYFLEHDVLLFADLLYRLEEIHKQAIQGMIPARPREHECRNYLCKKLPSEAVTIEEAKKIDGELRG